MYVHTFVRMITPLYYLPWLGSCQLQPLDVIAPVLYPISSLYITATTCSDGQQIIICFFFYCVDLYTYIIMSSIFLKETPDYRSMLWNLLEPCGQGELTCAHWGPP